MGALVLPTKFTAIDGISGPAKIMGKSIHDMVNAANTGLARQERLWRKMMPSMSGAVKNLASYATAGAGFAAIGASAKGITDNETALQSLQAVTMASDGAMAGFRKEINATANDAKKFAGDVAGSFEVVGSMMSQYLTDPKALNQISNAGITLSKASRAEVVPSLENLTSIMNQYDLAAGQALDTVNRLTAGEIVGSLRTSQLAESMQEFGAGAHAANVTLSESVALAEALAKQLKTDKIGVGARNILTVMDSAKGLDKKARKDLRHAGVDLAFLMDKTKTLSQRLRELSKISGNATVITSVFGKENKTAAQVIFNQLGTYDEYLAKIKVTNEAQRQAAINSDTVTNRVNELGATWLNYISTGDKATVGLSKLKGALVYVTDNMDAIVSVGVNVLKVFALWKGAMIAQRVVTTALSIHLGFQSAMVGFSSVAMKGNTIALAAQRVAQATLSVQTAITTGNFSALNAVIAANPIGFAVTAVAALAGGLYLLSKREDELLERYNEKRKLDLVKSFDNESNAVKRLAGYYMSLGKNMSDALAIGIRSEKIKLDKQRFVAEENVKKIKTDLEAEKNKLYVGDLFTGAFGEGRAMYGKRGDLANQLLEAEKKATNISKDQMNNVIFAKQQIDMGRLDKRDLGTAFNSPSTPKTPDWMTGAKADSPWAQNKKEDSGYYPLTESGGIDFLKLFEKLSKPRDPQEILVKFENAPPGTTATTVSGNSLTPSIVRSF